MDEKELVDIGKKAVEKKKKSEKKIDPYTGRPINPKTGKPKQIRPKQPERSARMLADFNTLPEGVGQKMISNNLELWNLPKIDTNDVEQVRQRTIDYFSIVAKNDVKPTVAAYAFALGVDRRTLWQYVNGIIPKPPEVQDTIKKAYEFLNLMMEDYMHNGQINPVSGIFLMKNNFGYQDKQEVVVTPANNLGEATDQKALEQKYMDAVVLDE